MSVKAELYKAISDRLIEKLNFAPEVELPNLKWVDKNKGQLIAFSQFGAIPLPACLISFPDINWQNAGNNNQTGLCRVKVILMYEVYADFDSESLNQEEALKCFEYEEQMYAALQGFSIDGVSPLERIKSSEEEDHDALVVFTQEYECMLTDTGANTYKNYTLVKPNLNVTYQRNLPDVPPKVKLTSGFNAFYKEPEEEAP